MKKILLLTSALLCNNAMAADGDIRSVHDLRELSSIYADNDPHFETRIAKFVDATINEKNWQKIDMCIREIQEIYGPHHAYVTRLKAAHDQIFDEKVQTETQGEYDNLFASYSNLQYCSGTTVDPFKAALRRALEPFLLGETDRHKFEEFSAHYGSFSSKVVEHYLNLMTQETNYEKIRTCLYQQHHYNNVEIPQTQALAAILVSHLLKTEDKDQITQDLQLLYHIWGDDQSNRQAIGAHLASLVLQESKAYPISCYLNSLKDLCGTDSQPVQKVTMHLSHIVLKETDPRVVEAYLEDILAVSHKKSEPVQKVAAYLLSLLMESNSDTIRQSLYTVLKVYNKKSKTFQSLITRFINQIPLMEEYPNVDEDALTALKLCGKLDPRIQGIGQYFCERAMLETDFEKLITLSQMVEEFYGKKSFESKTVVSRLADLISASQDIDQTFYVAKCFKNAFGPHNKVMRTISRHLVLQVRSIEVDCLYSMRLMEILDEAIKVFGVKNTSVKKIAAQYCEALCEQKYLYLSRLDSDLLLRFYKKNGSKIQSLVKIWYQKALLNNSSTSSESVGNMFRGVLALCDKDDPRVQSVLKHVISKVLEREGGILKQYSSEYETYHFSLGFASLTLLTLFGPENPQIQEVFTQLHELAMKSDSIYIITGYLHQLLAIYSPQDPGVIEVATHLKSKITQKQYRPFLYSYFQEQFPYFRMLDTLKAVFGQEGIEDIITRLAKQGARNEGWQAEKVYQLLADYVDEADPRMIELKQSIRVF